MATPGSALHRLCANAARAPGQPQWRAAPTSAMRSDLSRAPLIVRMMGPLRTQFRTMYDDTLKGKLGGRKLRCVVLHPAFADALVCEPNPVTGMLTTSTGTTSASSSSGTDSLRNVEATNVTISGRNRLKSSTTTASESAFLNTLLDREIPNAEEALGLARAIKWDILQGPRTPRGGWNENALAAADHAQEIYGKSAKDGFMAEYHVDSGEDEEYMEYDCDEIAWNTGSIRRQYAESCIVKMPMQAIGRKFRKNNKTQRRNSEHHNEADYSTPAMAMQHSGYSSSNAKNTNNPHAASSDTAVYASVATPETERTFFSPKTWDNLSKYIGEELPDVVFINAVLSVQQQAFAEETCRTILRRAKDGAPGEALLKARDGRNGEVDSVEEMQNEDEEREIPPYIEIVDRNRIVLEIFAARASTTRSRLQVTIAKLKYMKQRLEPGSKTRMRAMLEVASNKLAMSHTARKRDARKADVSSLEPYGTESMLLKLYEQKLNKSVATMKKKKDDQRRSRKKSGAWMVGLVGYTNAGKTAIINRLVRTDNDFWEAKPSGPDWGNGNWEGESEFSAISGGGNGGASGGISDLSAIQSIPGFEDGVVDYETAKFGGGVELGEGRLEEHMFGEAGDTLGAEQEDYHIPEQDLPDEVILNDLDTSSVWDASLAKTSVSQMGAETKYARLKTRDLVFQTLDTTMRQIRFPESGRTAVVADSVGFIQNLPHYLFDAFASTIEELTNCHVLIHVRDISHPHTEQQKKTVIHTLRHANFDFEKIPIVEVWNKCDKLQGLVQDGEQHSIGLLQEGDHHPTATTSNIPAGVPAGIPAAVEKARLKLLQEWAVEDQMTLEKKQRFEEAYAKQMQRRGEEERRVEERRRENIRKREVVRTRAEQANSDGYILERGNRNDVEIHTANTRSAEGKLVVPEESGNFSSAKSGTGLSLREKMDKLLRNEKETADEKTQREHEEEERKRMKKKQIKEEEQLETAARQLGSESRRAHSRMIKQARNIQAKDVFWWAGERSIVDESDTDLNSKTEGMRIEGGLKVSGDSVDTKDLVLSDHNERNLDYVPVTAPTSKSTFGSVGWSTQKQDGGVSLIEGVRYGHAFPIPTPTFDTKTQHQFPSLDFSTALSDNQSLNRAPFMRNSQWVSAAGDLHSTDPTRPKVIIPVSALTGANVQYLKEELERQLCRVLLGKNGVTEDVANGSDVENENENALVNENENDLSREDSFDNENVTENVTNNHIAESSVSACDGVLDRGDATVSQKGKTLAFRKLRKVQPPLAVAQKDQPPPRKAEETQKEVENSRRRDDTMQATSKTLTSPPPQKASRSLSPPRTLSPATQASSSDPPSSPSAFAQRFSTVKYPSRFHRHVVRYFDREKMKLGHDQFSVEGSSGSVMQVRVLLDPLQKKRLGTVLMEAKMEEQRL